MNETTKIPFVSEAPIKGVVGRCTVLLDRVNGQVVRHLLVLGNEDRSLA